MDSDRRGDLIKNHKTFLSVGHDEYWSGPQRANVEAARDAGVNLAFFSGNEVFWKTRWENSAYGTQTDHRTLVTYKETHSGAKIDPQDPPTWTGTWRDPRFSPPADGGRPENNLTGTLFTVNCCTTDMHVGGTYKNLRFWRNTRVANLVPGATTTLAAASSDTSGTRVPTTVLGRPAWSTCPPTARTSPATCRTTAPRTHRVARLTT